jgi:hypothetical protein
MDSEASLHFWCTGNIINYGRGINTKSWELIIFLRMVLVSGVISYKFEQIRDFRFGSVSFSPEFETCSATASTAFKVSLILPGTCNADPDGMNRL